MEPEFEITEEQLKPKPVPSGMKHVTPSLEGAAIIKQSKTYRIACSKSIEEKEREENKILAELATRVFLLEQTLNKSEDKLKEKGLKNLFRELRSIKNQLFKALKNAQITIEDPAGSSIDSLKDKVEIIGWLPGDEERVKETHEPIIIRKGEIIKLGQITALSPSTDQGIPGKEKQKDENK